MQMEINGDNVKDCLGQQSDLNHELYSYFLFKSPICKAIQKHLVGKRQWLVVPPVGAKHITSQYSGSGGTIGKNIKFDGFYSNDGKQLWFTVGIEWYISEDFYKKTSTQLSVPWGLEQNFTEKVFEEWLDSQRDVFNKKISEKVEELQKDIEFYQNLTK